MAKTIKFTEEEVSEINTLRQNVKKHIYKIRTTSNRKEKKNR